MLKEKFYEQHQHMRAQLDMAGRYGLSLQQDVEELQDAQVQSYAQVQIQRGKKRNRKKRKDEAPDIGKRRTWTRTVQCSAALKPMVILCWEYQSLFLIYIFFLSVLPYKF